MSERDIVFRWLGSAARRIRLNERLEDASRLLVALMALAIAYQFLNATVSARPVMSALLPLLLLIAAATIVFFAWRIFGRDLLSAPDRAGAAALVDARASLKNELSSAFWFISASLSDRFIGLHLARAAETVQHLQLPRLLPLTVPRGLPVAGVLAMVAILLIWMPSRLELAADHYSSVDPGVQRAAGLTGVHEAAEEDDSFADDEFVADRSAVAWLKVEQLARELRAGPDTTEVAQAIAARDARTASRLLAGMRGEQAAQPAAGRAATPETEQMSAQLAEGIIDRLQSLLSEGGGWSGQAGGGDSADSAERLTEQLTRELREEMADAQPGERGEMSPEEQALNTTLQAMSRDSTGGREAIRGEADPMPGLGRTTVGSGAMGRRIGVSTAGAGEGEQPHANPDGDAEAEPVLGRKTLRLQLKMQTITIDESQTQSEDGNQESFFAATQAQAASTRYEDIVARQQGGVERSGSGEQLPLAYRDAAKEYSVRQHRREAVPGQ